MAEEKNLILSVKDLQVEFKVRGKVLKAIRNFVLIAIFTTFLQAFFGIIFASFFIRRIPLSKFYRIIFYLPVIATAKKRKTLTVDMEYTNHWGSIDLENSASMNMIIIGRKIPPMYESALARSASPILVEEARKKYPMLLMRSSTESTT